MKKYYKNYNFQMLIVSFLGALSQPVIAFAYTLIDLNFERIIETLNIILYKVLPIVFIGLLLSSFSYILKGYLSNKVLNYLRKDLFSSILNMPINDFNKRDSGEYYNVILKKADIWKSRSYN